MENLLKHAGVPAEVKAPQCDVTYTLHLNGRSLVLIYVVSHPNQFSGWFGFETIADIVQLSSCEKAPLI